MNALMPSSQTNGISLDLEMNSDLLDQLGWRSYWYELNDQLQKELERTRKVRPLLPLLGDQSLDPDAIADYAVSESPLRESLQDEPEALSIPTRPRLVSAEISCKFRLSPDQLGNIDAAKRLITNAAHQLALAEDAVLLLGNDLDGTLTTQGPQPVNPEAVRATRTAFLKLSIDPRNLNLEQQTRKLLQCTLAPLNRCRLQYVLGLQFTDEVEKSQNKKNLRDLLSSIKPFGTLESLRTENAAALALTPAGRRDLTALLAERFFDLDSLIVQRLVELNYFHYMSLRGLSPKGVLDAILRGISDLQERGHYGEYCALVAPDLYQQAYTPAQGDISSAPIYQILPRLREGGFGCSMMVPPGMGVMCSLGGSTVGLAVPREANVTFLSKDRDVYLSVQERIRLIINEPLAVVQLRDD